MTMTKAMQPSEPPRSHAARLAGPRLGPTTSNIEKIGLASLRVGLLVTFLSFLPTSAAAQYAAPSPSQGAYPAQAPAGYGQSAYPSQQPPGYAQGGYPAATGQAPVAPQAVRIPIFAHVLGGAWIPWPGAFAENHRPGGAVDVMVGLSCFWISPCLVTACRNARSSTT